MQPAQYGNGDNGAKSLAGSCQVRARLIVIRRVGTKNPPQVRLTAADHLVQTFATQGADQTFRIAILPRRLRGNRSVAENERQRFYCGFDQHHLRPGVSMHQTWSRRSTLDKDAPISRAIQTVGRIPSVPILGGLDHQYVRI